MYWSVVEDFSTAPDRRVHFRRVLSFLELWLDTDVTGPTVCSRGVASLKTNDGNRERETRI